MFTVHCSNLPSCQVRVAKYYSLTLHRHAEFAAVGLQSMIQTLKHPHVPNDTLMPRIQQNVTM